MHVHLVGVSGTGMGSLAMLFREDGHEVTGSDAAFDPPTGPALRAAGVRCLEGYRPENLDGGADLVVVGNVIRRDNPEAVAVEQRGLARVSMSRALREHFLARRRPLVVCGTHGKTTTSAMAAAVLLEASLEPGWFIGGQPSAGGAAKLACGAAVGRRARGLVSGAAPFVVEGDEYDAVYWDKKPKFLDYVGVGSDDVAIVTSIEHDHIDIYPDAGAYEAAFRELVRAMPEGGLLVGDARDGAVRALFREARCRTTFYALDGDDTGDVTPEWLAALAPIDDAGLQPFDTFVGGSACGRFALRVPGAHNVRDALAALAAASVGFGVPLPAARRGLATFPGMRRRQELRGSPGGVRVYDDFAHHPTAVAETLAALRARHREGALVAVFEPRSATASRSLHQQAYAGAFAAADQVVLAPVGRANIPEAERLDVARLAREIGPRAAALPDVSAIVARLAAELRSGDTVVILSNGAFGGIHEKLLSALQAKPP